MARDPRWLVHRSGQTVTVKVGFAYAPTHYQMPAALESELHSWFRRRGLQGGFAGLVIVGALIVVATQSWIESDAPVWVAFVALVAFWPLLSGAMPRRFTHKFPQAILVGPDGQPVDFVEHGVAFNDTPNGTVELKPMYGAAPAYRIPASQAERARTWYRGARRVSWAMAVLLIGAIAALNSSDRLTSAQATVATLALVAVWITLSITVSRVLFRKAFPDAVPLPGRKSLLAVQAERPVILRLFMSLLVCGLLIWGLSTRDQEITTNDLVFIGLVAGLTAYSVAVAAYRFRHRARSRPGAPD